MIKRVSYESCMHLIHSPGVLDQGFCYVIDLMLLFCIALGRSRSTLGSLFHLVVIIRDSKRSAQRGITL